MPLIISKAGKNVTKVNRSAIDKESYLQKYIKDNPDTIPFEETREDLRLVVVAREFSTQSGPIDALGIDDAGALYIIETKLHKNPDKRFVIAQALDYGAALWGAYHDPDEFVLKLDAHLSKTEKTSLRKHLQGKFGLDEAGTDELIGNIQANMKGGNFNIVVLMDVLDEKLKNLVTFLYRNSKFSVYAVEVDYYRYDDYEVLIPHLFGTEVVKDLDVSGSSTRHPWDEETFFADAKEELNAGELQAVRELYNFSKNLDARITWGTGKNRGSFNVKVDRISKQSLYTVFSNGDLNINFGWLDKSPVMEKYRPRGDILPVRSLYNDTGNTNIGLNPLTSTKPIWYSGPDLATSKLQTGQTPMVIEAFKLVPSGTQRRMKDTRIGTRNIHPETDDFFRAIIEERKSLPKTHPHYLLLKIIANSLYGIFAELNKYEYGKNNAHQLGVFSSEIKFTQPTCVVEREGQWHFPPAAALITAGGAAHASDFAGDGRRTKGIVFAHGHGLTTFCRFQEGRHGSLSGWFTQNASRNPRSKGDNLEASQ